LIDITSFSISQNMNAKVVLFNKMNRADNQYSDVGMMIDTSAMDLNSTHGALYAETLSNICIIFTILWDFHKLHLNCIQSK
jgi:hypothetical protein